MAGPGALLMKWSSLPSCDGRQRWAAVDAAATSPPPPPLPGAHSSPWSLLGRVCCLPLSVSTLWQTKQHISTPAACDIRITGYLCAALWACPGNWSGLLGGKCGPPSVELELGGTANHEPQTPCYTLRGRKCGQLALKPT